MFRYCLFIAAMLSFASSNAAEFAVKGTVADNSGEPEAFATVRVFAEGDTLHAKALGITSEEGLFDLALKNRGNYRIKITSVGKKNIDKGFTLTPEAPVVDLGIMTMYDNAAELGEIEVVASRPLVQKEIDRIGYDVQADDDSKTSSIQDILRKVPMVTVESDGSIKVRGSSNFKIYKNGRPNNAFTSNTKDIFAAIPASMIKKIEVITDPGAKEDAEGVGAILNIVTMEETNVNGIMGNINARMFTRNAVPFTSAWFTTNIGKVALSAHGGYFHQGEKISASESQSEYRYVNTGNIQKSSSNKTGKGNVGFWGIDGSYELDSLNLLTMEFGGFTYGMKATQSSFVEMSSAYLDPIYSYRTETYSPKTSFLDFNGSINYQRLTRRKDEIITLSYRISNNSSDDDVDNRYLDLVNFPAPFTSSSTTSTSKFLEQTAQLDWTRPFLNHNKFATGLKFIHRNNHSIADNRYEGMGDNHSDFVHKTSIGAVYFDYRYSLDRLNARAGLRYEYSRLSAKFKDGSQDDFGSDLNDWVPNASIMYNLSDASTIKAAYSTRINRPGINYLNPNVTLTPESQSFGNPNLESIHFNSLSLNYSLMKQRFNIDATLSYDFADNTITSVTTADASDFKTTTYGNIGKNRQTSLDIFFQWSITDKTTFMINGDVNYRHLEIPGVKNHHWGYNMFVRATQQLPWKLRLEAHLFYDHGNLNSLYSYNDNGIRAFYHGFSLQRSFLKGDKLTVRIDAMNPFQFKGYCDRSVTNRGDYLGWSEEISRQARQYGISIGFRFGSVKSTVKKTAHTISNTDMEGGSQAPSSAASFSE